MLTDPLSSYVSGCDHRGDRLNPWQAQAISHSLHHKSGTNRISLTATLLTNSSARGAGLCAIAGKADQQTGSGNSKVSFHGEGSELALGD
jgi:hypothetical protein